MSSARDAAERQSGRAVSVALASAACAIVSAGACPPLRAVPTGAVFADAAADIGPFLPPRGHPNVVASFATAMATKGETFDVVVVGAMTVVVDEGPPAVTQVHAFLWSASGNDYYSAGLHDLSVAAGVGTTESVAAGVNVRCEVVGQIGSGVPGDGAPCIFWPAGSDAATITNLSADLSSCLLETPPGIALDISDDTDPHVVGVLNFCDAEGNWECPQVPVYRGFYIRGSSETQSVQLLTIDPATPSTFIFGEFEACGLGVFFDGSDIYCAGYQIAAADVGCGAASSVFACPDIEESTPVNFAMEEGVTWLITEGSPATATASVLAGPSATLDEGYAARGSEPGGIIVGYAQEPVFDGGNVIGCPWEAVIWADRTMSPVSLNPYISPQPDLSWAEGVRNCTDEIVRVAGTGGGNGIYSAVAIHDALGSPCGAFLDAVTFVAAPAWAGTLHRAVAVNDQGLMAVVGGFLVGSDLYYETFVVTHWADLNADAHIDGADLGIVFGHWGSSDPIADANGDGSVNGGDLGVIIGNWTGSGFLTLPSPCCDPCEENNESVALFDLALAYAGFADAEEFMEWGAQAEPDSVSSVGEAMAALVKALR